MITRVRIEGVGEEEAALKLELVAEAVALRDKIGGEWTDEGSPETMTVKGGHWGRYSIRRESPFGTP